MTLRLRFFEGCLLVTVALMLTACSSDAVLSGYLELNRAQIDRPVDPDAALQQFVVAPGTPARTIAENLQNHGLIADARLFEAYVRANGIAPRLQAGTYQLSAAMTIVQIADALQHSRPDEIAIRVGEGWRLEQTADYLDTNTPLDGREYRRRAEAGDLSGMDAAGYDFLSTRPEGATLEGYLYPDTYRLKAEGEGAADLIERQLDRFADSVMPYWREAQARQTPELTLHQVLTVASIVEREAAIDDERPIIAGVYLNRVARGMKLQADPTVQYAMGYQPDTKRWWKVPMFLAEYDEVDSPYNTYLYAGLPPGPICNPSIESIQAVLVPAEHSFLYFMARPDGSGRHRFAATYEEHLENVQKYQRGQ